MEFNQNYQVWKQINGVPNSAVGVKELSKTTLRKMKRHTEALLDAINYRLRYKQQYYVSNS